LYGNSAATVTTIQQYLGNGSDGCENTVETVMK